MDNASLGNFFSSGSTASGCGRLMPRKNSFILKICMCLAIKSPIVTVENKSVSKRLRNHTHTNFVLLNNLNKNNNYLQYANLAVLLLKLEVVIMCRTFKRCVVYYSAVTYFPYIKSSLYLNAHQKFLTIRRLVCVL